MMSNQEIDRAKDQVRRDLAEGRIGQETADTALSQLAFLRRHNDLMDDTQVFLEDPEGYLRRAAGGLPDFFPGGHEDGGDPPAGPDLDGFLEGSEET